MYLLTAASAIFFGTLLFMVTVAWLQFRELDAMRNIQTGRLDHTGQTLAILAAVGAGLFLLGSLIHLGYLATGGFLVGKK